jgi:hypothetical protein
LYYMLRAQLFLWPHYMPRRGKKHDSYSCHSTLATSPSYGIFFFFVIKARSICPRRTAAYSLIVRPLSPRDL